MALRAPILLTFALVVAGCSAGSRQPAAETTAETAAEPTRTASARGRCPVTRPNGRIPPGESASPGARSLGNGALWTELYPRPHRPRREDVRADGRIVVKVPWWRGVTGRLAITGRRLVVDAPALTAWIPSWYGRTGFQSTAVTFPTPGCWEVTGRVRDASLTFVTLVAEPSA